jgi:hypothetical protein
MSSLKGLIYNRNYLFLYFSMMCVLGTANAFNVTIGPFLAPFGIGSKQSGIALALNAVTGLTGAMISSFYSKNSLIQFGRPKLTFELSALN